MEDSKLRRSWRRSQSDTQLNLAYARIGLFVVFAVSLCLSERSYAVERNGVSRVGMLFNVLHSKNDLRKQLAEQGWIDGRNLIVDERYTGGTEVRIHALARELVNAKSDVIVATSSFAARAAMKASRTIPIIALGDPVGDKLVSNPLQPEANLTGLITTEPPEVSGKRLELLKQALPNLMRVDVLVPSYIPTRWQNLKNTQHAATALGMSIQARILEHPNMMKDALSKMINPQALVILAWAMKLHQEEEIFSFAARMKLPTVYTRRGFVERGGFMSYGPVRTHTWKRAAMMVNKLLKGAKPAELPVERPLNYELVINLKTANGFGLTVAPELLLQANEVIR